MPVEEQGYSGVSSEAVKKATGKGWPDWLEFLDALDGEKLDHKGIVALIAGPGGLSNGWWQQSVAVGYEQARGLRVVGQTSGADFQIGVQKTLPIPAEEAWLLLTEGPGLAAWLGEARGLDLRKGAEYRTADGCWGEVRSAASGQRIRLTWNSPLLAQESTLQVMLVPGGEKTSVRFHQERLSNPEERERMREYWRGALEELLLLSKGA